MGDIANLTERTKKFWEWFSKNEERLSEITQRRDFGSNEEDAVNMNIEFINEGVSLISEDIKFNVGGDHEFTFAIDGDYAMFFVLPYVTANMPEKYRGKWHFFPCMQGTHGESFGFRMCGAAVETDRVMVSAAASGNGVADIRFHAKEWASLEESDRYTAFFVLLDITVGEAMANICLGDIEWADAPSHHMFPLTQLEEWIRENLCEDGQPPDPLQRIFAFEREPEGDGPRDDVFAGYASYMNFMQEYDEGEDAAYQRVAALGAKPMFLFYNYDRDSTGEEVLNERQSIMDDIEGKVLGEPGSGREIGIVLGGASGRSYMYIDLLLYDEQAFMEKAREMFAASPFMVFGKEFRQEGEEFVLTDHRQPGFTDRLLRLHDIGGHKGVIRAIESLPQEKVDFDVIGLYSRALNNDGQVEKALAVLESVRDRGEGDALWNWRTGYALFFLFRIPESVTYLEKAIRLGDDHPETAELLQLAHEILKRPEMDAERRAAKAPRDPKREPFKGFSLDGFWDDGEEAQEYTGGPASDKQIADAEKTLGYRLPESYKRLIKQRNGG
ncbi:MAG: SMI1/KNR4 family protein, partial [Methanomassiliicoccaceae archaeon]|nr:SMI1/KNR4 family protein [Methanomassiliicoccaceae archaeon]